MRTAVARRVGSAIGSSTLALLGLLIIMPLEGSAEPTVKGAMPPARYNEGKVHTYKRSPVPFKPLMQMYDPATKRKVGPSEMITLPNGKRVQAGAYYAELNRIEEGLNRLGYSLRDKEGRDPRTGKRTGKLREIVVNEPLLRQQSEVIKGAFMTPDTAQQAPFKLDQVPMMNKRFQDEVRAASVTTRGETALPPATNEEEKAFLEEQTQALKDQALMDRIQGDRTLDVAEVNEEQAAIKAAEISQEFSQSDQQEGIRSRGLTPMSEEQKNNFAQWRETNRQLAEGAVTATGEPVTSRGLSVTPRGLDIPRFSDIAGSPLKSLTLLPPKPTNANQVHKSYNWNWPMGEPDTISAYVRGRASLDGTSTLVQLGSEAEVGGSALGSSVNLLHGLGGAVANSNGNSVLALRLSVFGSEVVNVLQVANTAWSKTDNLSKTVDRATPPIAFPIIPGVVSVQLKIGIILTGGVGYTVGLQPVRAYANLGPFVSAKAYGQAELDAIVVSAGVEGRILLAQENLLAHTDIGLKVVDSKWAYTYVFAVSHDLTLLQGQLDAYIEYGYPCADFWEGFWCEDKWSTKLFGWPGFRHQGFLVNQSQTIYL